MDAKETNVERRQQVEEVPADALRDGHLLVAFRIKEGNVPKSHREKQGPLQPPNSVFKNPG